MERLNEIFHQLCEGEVDENVYIDFIKNQDVSTKWLYEKLKDAYEQLDALKIEYLLSCIRLPSFCKKNDGREILHLYCEIMLDARFSYSAESIADALGYCQLEKEYLQYFIKFCTSPHLKMVGADLRKVFDSMYFIYEGGRCSKSEIITSFQEILWSSNFDVAWQECVKAYIEKINMEEEYK